MKKGHHSDLTLKRKRFDIHWILPHSLKFILSFIFILSIVSCASHSESHDFKIPESYLLEPDEIPLFWKSTLDEVFDFLDKQVHHGQVSNIGISAGGRPIKAVFYGNPRQGKGTSTFSGSLGYRDVSVYRGPDHDKRVYVGMSGVHGGEFEGIIGTVNLISVLETGKDLRGEEWPEITAAAGKIDRLIIIPVMNPDGRARVPVRMLKYNGESNTTYQYLNTGGKIDGTNIGWPQVKEFIPMDFQQFSFPGGYPNDAGVNIMHDDFFGKHQPETQALFDLFANEKPDLVLNMHTGAPPKNYYMRMHRPFAEAVLDAVFDSLYVKVHTRLTREGLQGTRDPKTEADFRHVKRGVFNLDGAINLHCGALSVVIESPCHSFSGTDREGNLVLQTPEMILDAQLICHQEAMIFLNETGGRALWTP